MGQHTENQPLQTEATRQTELQIPNSREQVLEAGLDSLEAGLDELGERTNQIRDIYEDPRNSELAERLSEELGRTELREHQTRRALETMGRELEQAQARQERAYNQLRDGETVTDRELADEMVRLQTEMLERFEGYSNDSSLRAEAESAGQAYAEFMGEHANRLGIYLREGEPESQINQSVETLQEYHNHRDRLETVKQELGLVGELDIETFLDDAVQITKESQTLARGLSAYIEGSPDRATNAAPLVREAVELYQENWRDLSYIDGWDRFGSPLPAGDFQELMKPAASLLNQSPEAGMQVVRDTDLVDFQVGLQRELAGDWEGLYAADTSRISFQQAYNETDPATQAQIREGLRERYPFLRDVPDEGFMENEDVQSFLPNDRYMRPEEVLRFNEARSEHDVFYYHGGNIAGTDAIRAFANLPEGSPERAEALGMLRDSGAMETLFKRMTTHVSGDGGADISFQHQTQTMGSSSLTGPADTLIELSRAFPELLAEFDREFMPAITPEELEDYNQISGREWLERNFPDPNDSYAGEFWQRGSGGKGQHNRALRELHQILSSQR